MLEAAGYPDKKGALAAVAKSQKVPAPTLRGWFTGQHNPPPLEVRHEKRLDLVEAIRNELDHIFPELSDRRQDASYRELVTAAGILVDKLQLLTGRPTERTAVINMTWGDIGDVDN